MAKNITNKKLIASGVLAAIILAAVSMSVFTGQSEEASTVAADARTNDAATPSPTPSPTATAQSAATPASALPASDYKDGTYSASASYRTPESTESIDVTLTVANGVVTGSAVSQTPQDRKSAIYQKYFAESYKTYVVGRSIDSISLSRVSGSSLTSAGFNKALSAIKAQAKA